MRIFVHLVCLFILGVSVIAVGETASNSLYPYYPSGQKLSPDDTLFVIENGAMNDAERMMILTLAGVVAQQKPCIFVRIGAGYDIWLDDLEYEYGLFIDDSFRNDPWGLLAHFKGALEDSAFVLYNLGQSSTNVAVSLSGVWRAVGVDESIAAQAQAAGLRQKTDVRGKDEQWCFENYWQLFNHGLLVQQKEPLFGLRDYGPLARAFSFFDGNSDFMRRVMEAADDDSPILGWGDASQGEDKFVKAASERSVFTVASDHAWNLSLFSAMQVDSLYQRTHTEQETTAPAVHTVVFVMSDGDNIQWLMNDFSTNERWYGSPLRGMFNMGWTISPSLAALAPTVMDRLYRDAATGPGRDFFVCGVSGGGYLYPSYYPDLATHCDRLDDWLQAADLNIVTILERRRGYFTPEILDNYTRQPQVLGCFYLDYAKYDAYNGKIVWSNGKPVVSARLNLWQGFDSPESIARIVNISPTDPANPLSYSFISVHPWSKSLEDVQKTISLFESDIEVATPEVFMRRIIANVPHEPNLVHDKTAPGDFRFTLYPNPVAGGATGPYSSAVTLRFQASSNKLPRHVRIVDVLGRTVHEWIPSMTPGMSSLTLSWDGRLWNGAPASPGIYFVQAVGEASMITHKFAIVR